MSQLNLRKRKRVCYYEPEEPPFDEYIFCTECRDYVYEYCSIHGPLLVVPDDKILDANHKPSHMVDAQDPNTSNWMRYVNCSRHYSEQNLVAYQYKGQLYYRTVKLIPRYTELLVFYGSGFARELGVDLRHYRAACPCAHCRAQQPENPALIKRRKRQAQINEKPVEEKIARKAAVEKIQQAPNRTSVNIHQNGDERIESTVQPVFNTPNVQKNKTNEVEQQKAVFTCNKCKESFVVKKDLEKHLHTHSLDVKKCDDSLTKSNTKTKCDKCNISFETGTELVKHIFTHKAKTKISADKYICKSCHSKFETNICLMEHMESQHGVKCLACTECDYRTIYEHRLVQHKRTHTGEKPYKCDVCEYKAAQSISLKLHLMSVHAGVKPFKCRHCNYACSQKGTLVKHERTHTGEKPYKCDICDYKTVHSGHLKQHLMSVHAGLKPFKCRHCNHTCSQKAHLVQHERTHTGEKPYKCDICEYKAAQSISLKLHLMSVHAGVKPFKCSHCDYACSQKGTLVQHERTHTGEKPYKCDICEYKAAHSNNLKQHVMRIHAVVKP